MTTMEIISRARWGARHDRGFGPAPLPASEVWLHHSVTVAPDLEWIDADGDGVDDDEERAMRTLEAIGEQRFGGGISYTWLVMPSGRIYDGHGVDRQGAHTGGRNSRSRAICFVGNYETRRPTPAQVRATAWLLQHAHRHGWIRAPRLTGGHRDLKATACPGRHAYALIDDINRLAGGELIEEDDMPTAREVADAILSTELDMGWRRPGARENHHATVRTVLSWTDRRHQALARQLAELAGRLAGQDAVLRQLADGRELDLVAIADTTEAAVRRALEESTVRVDVDVTGPEEPA